MCFFLKLYPNLHYCRKKGYKDVLLFSALLYQVAISSGELEDSKNKDLIEIQLSTSGREPVGKPGLAATYRHESGGLIPGSVVRTFTLAIGPITSAWHWRKICARTPKAIRIGI